MTFADEVDAQLSRIIGASGRSRLMAMATSCTFIAGMK
jgi:hypothetical protein